MPRSFDLEQKSREFKSELDELLNRTICTGISLKSIFTPGSRDRTVVGYNITKDNQDVADGIPVTTGAQDARFFLGLSIRLAPDDERNHLMVTSSVMILANAADVSDDGNVLLHYDYERDKKYYSEAHLQICASSDAWEAAGRRLDGKDRLLERLHLPAGGRRFRPTLEDMIEFLVGEKLAAAHEGWDVAVQESRSRFEKKQLSAAVRASPDTATAELKRLGYQVTPPRK